MAHISIYDNDAFSLAQLTAALDLVPYAPNLLGSLNIFEPDYLRGTDIAVVEKRDNVLSLIHTSDRGAPLDQLDNAARDIRAFKCNRIAKGDRLQSSELFRIRAFGTESELSQVQAETARRLAAIRNDIEATWEYHRLGAIQGIVLDAPVGGGQPAVLKNWFTEWGFAQPDEIDFALDEVDTNGVGTTDVRAKCHEVIRTMRRAAKGAWVENVTRAHALAGDAFYDALINHSAVRQTYLNGEAAASLRQNVAFQAFEFGGIVWHNYQGTDDNSTIAVATDSAKFFPVGARDVFKVAWAPGESFAELAAPGQPIYPVVVPEARPDPRWVDIEEYSYPLFMCLRPEMLLRAKRT